MSLPGEKPMNFRKLPKEKRNHLVLVVAVTLITVAGLYLGLIRRQNESLARLAQQKDGAAQKLKTVLGAIHLSDRMKTELDEARNLLAQSETDVASGDLYAWVINSLRQFKAPYKVEIPQFSQLGTVADVTFIPNFPYKQATLTVAGTAHYHDLGRFVADFENQFPHVRLSNLSLDANAPSPNVEPETLSFKVDIITLVKTNPS
jgi:Tfp pilus assembly protein PilO